MDLRTLQASWHLGHVAPEKAHVLATDLLLAGVESPALIELAGMVDATSYWQVAPVIERVCDEAGLPPISHQAALWRQAYATARRIGSGALSPLAGATTLLQVCNELGMPEPLRYFVYLAAAYGEESRDPAAQAAWFDARIRETAGDLLAGMPPDGESPPAA